MVGEDKHRSFPTLRSGFSGNQPFLTLSSWSKSSLTVQRQVMPNTATMALIATSSTNREAIIERAPMTAKIGQMPLPKRYSPLITTTWNAPMRRNEAIPTARPQNIMPMPSSTPYIRCWHQHGGEHTFFRRETDGHA